ncbi:Cell division protein FtsI [Lachnospiraceae bacterium TWA4]|nr:Cell division protein FtsI [Lachnospiraceae bacterium TWA4]
MMYQSNEYLNSTYNKRLDKLSESVTRGSILASDGSTLADTTVNRDKSVTRNYPYKNQFAQVVGYSTRGQTGIEAITNYTLLNTSEDTWSKIKKQIFDEPIYGNSVVTTLNPKIQKIVYDAMGDKKGACVVMEPSTGRILAMVSKPDYNPNKINQIYDELVSDNKNSNLVNRATRGQYSPGSTFKIVTLLEYIKENPDTYEDFSYNCTGSITYEGKTVKCSHGAHGVVNLKQAFAKSCNGAFITMGLSLNMRSFRKTAKTLLFNDSIPFEISSKQSSFDLTSKSSDWDIMQTVFGQGKTLVTPLHNALILSAIANGGVLMKPYVVESIQSPSGKEVDKVLPETYKTLMSPKEAEILKEYMVYCVNRGTGKVVKTKKYQAAAKTGSAETKSTSEANAWFVSFAPADEAKVVVSVVLEEAGAGGENAGPIAKKVFDALLVD